MKGNEKLLTHGADEEEQASLSKIQKVREVPAAASRSAVLKARWNLCSTCPPIYQRGEEMSILNEPDIR